jgi:integrase
MTFVRPVECRDALWTEFHLDGNTPLWRLPAKKMKMSDDFLVPLSKQVVSLMRELRPFTSDDRCGRVFPGVRPGKALSENTLNSAIRAMGYTRNSTVRTDLEALPALF